MINSKIHFFFRYSKNKILVDLNSRYGDYSNIFNEDIFDAEKSIQPLTKYSRSIDISNENIESKENLKEVGKFLFNILFKNEALGIYMQHRNNDKKTVISLDFTEAPMLHILPWELLYDSTNSSFLNLSTQISIIRYLKVSIEKRKVAIQNQIIKILLIIPKSSNLDSHKEQSNLEKVLCNSIESHEVMLDVIHDVSIKILQQKLINKNYHVIHFIGHGFFDKEKGTGNLVFQNSYGNREYIDMEVLGSLLISVDSVKLLILNSCDTSKTSLENSFEGLSQRILQLGIPAVIAMQQKISDDSAIVFSEQLYFSIKKNRSIDDAVTDARKAIFSQGRFCNEWYIPTLYTRITDLHLFNFQHSSSFREICSKEKNKILKIVISILLIFFSLFFYIKAHFHKKTIITMLDEKNQSIPNVTINIPSIPITGKTNERGVFFFYSINTSSASFEVFIEKKGYKSKNPDIPLVLKAGTSNYEKLFKIPK